MARNPPWTRDELILALELYFRLNPLHTTYRNPEIQRLSRELNSLPAQRLAVDKGVYRNPTGVYMKLCNFLRFDPGYTGAGLRRGGRQEEIIWKEFANDTDRLSRISAAIRAGAREINVGDADISVIEAEQEEFEEGRILTVLHKRRERAPRLVEAKKQAVLKVTTALRCEACGFDFYATYGALGRGFAECHHLMPLSALSCRRRTLITDLAILCSNCHRMIHRARPMISISELRQLIVH